MTYYYFWMFCLNTASKLLPQMDFVLFLAFVSQDLEYCAWHITAI